MTVLQHQVELSICSWIGVPSKDEQIRIETISCSSILYVLRLLFGFVCRCVKIRKTPCNIIMRPAALDEIAPRLDGREAVCVGTPTKRILCDMLATFSSNWWNTIQYNAANREATRECGECACAGRHRRRHVDRRSERRRRCRTASPDVRLVCGWLEIFRSKTEFS